MASESTEENKQNDGEKKVENDRLCEYYVSARGCIKNDKCDFLHPKSPNGSVTNRVCDYYNQNRGCIKNETCDFLHVHPRGFGNSMNMNMAPMGRGGGGFGRSVPFSPPVMRGGYGSLNISRGGPNNNNNNNNNNGGDDKQCKYFLTNRGCIKGDKCDFSHGGGFNTASHYPSFHSSSHHSSQQFSQFRQPFQHDPYINQRGAPSRPLRPKKCEFHNTERGCVKGDQCDFIHEKNQVCDFFNTSRGCRKGEACDFQHPTKDGNKASSDGPVYGASSKKRPGPY